MISEPATYPPAVVATQSFDYGYKVAFSIHNNTQLEFSGTMSVPLTNDQVTKLRPPTPLNWRDSEGHTIFSTSNALDPRTIEATGPTWQDDIVSHGVYRTGGAWRWMFEIEALPSGEATVIQLFGAKRTNRMPRSSLPDDITLEAMINPLPADRLLTLNLRDFDGLIRKGNHQDGFMDENDQRVNPDRSGSAGNINNFAGSRGFFEIVNFQDSSHQSGNFQYENLWYDFAAPNAHAGNQTRVWANIHLYDADDALLATCITGARNNLSAGGTTPSVASFNLHNLDYRDNSVDQNRDGFASQLAVGSVGSMAPSQVLSSVGDSDFRINRANSAYTLNRGAFSQPASRVVGELFSDPFCTDDLFTDAPDNGRQAASDVMRAEMRLSWGEAQAFTHLIRLNYRRTSGPVILEGIDQSIRPVGVSDSGYLFELPAPASNVDGVNGTLEVSYNHPIPRVDVRPEGVRISNIYAGEASGNFELNVLESTANANIIGTLFGGFFTDRTPSIWPLTTVHAHYESELDGPAWFWWMVTLIVLGMIALLFCSLQLKSTELGWIAYSIVFIGAFALGAVQTWVLLVAGILPLVTGLGLTRLAKKG